MPINLAAINEEVHAIASKEVTEFVRRLTLPLIAGKGDALPVSLFPVDGTWPTGTAKYEKRNLALQIPVVETDLCTRNAASAFSSARIQQFAPRSSRLIWSTTRRSPSSIWRRATRITRPARA